jgi:uncharacterized protein (DUF302 family)
MKKSKKEVKILFKSEKKERHPSVSNGKKLKLKIIFACLVAVSKKFYSNDYSMLLLLPFRVYFLLDDRSVSYFLESQEF